MGYLLYPKDEISFGKKIKWGEKLTAKLPRSRWSETLFSYEYGASDWPWIGTLLDWAFAYSPTPEWVANRPEQRWREGVVNQEYEHMKVYYRHDALFLKEHGRAFSDCYTLVALVAPGTGNQFVVQSLVDPHQGGSETDKMLVAARREFDLYLRMGSCMAISLLPLLHHVQHL